MIDKKKTILYWCIIGVLEIVGILFATVCLIKYSSQDNYLTGLSFLSVGILVLIGVLLIFHIKKIFCWYYKKAQANSIHATPEFFSSSLFLLSLDKAYKRLKYITLILSGVNIVLQIVLLFIEHI